MSVLLAGGVATFSPRPTHLDTNHSDWEEYADHEEFTACEAYAGQSGVACP